MAHYDAQKVEDTIWTALLAAMRVARYAWGPETVAYNYYDAVKGIDPAIWEVFSK